MLSELVCKKYLEYQDSIFLFTFQPDKSTTHSPETNEQLRELLSSLVGEDNMTVKLSVETPTKSFGDWTFSKIYIAEWENETQSLLLFIIQQEA